MDYGVITPQQDGSVLLESGDSPRLLKGLDMLVMILVIELCSDPSDEGGSGFAAGLKEMPLGDKDAYGILGDRLNLARDHIIGLQRDEKLADDERLSDLELVALREGTDGWEADIRLTAVSGESLVRSFS